MTENAILNTTVSGAGSNDTSQKSLSTRFFQNRPQLVQLLSLLKNSRHCLVIFPPSASLDVIASGLSLQNLILNNFADCSLLTPSLSSEKWLEKLSFTERISQKIGKDNLVVRFEYSPEQVDNVSYHIGEHTQKFYLTIKPQKGFAPLAVESVEFDYVGIDADLIILLDVFDLNDLEHLYMGYESFFTDTTIVSIAHAPVEFASLNVLPTMVGFSDLVAQLFYYTQLNIDADTATNLLAGIEWASDSFSDLALQADVFETVAYLLRSGARRMRWKSDHQQVVSLPVQNYILPKIKVVSGGPAQFSQEVPKDHAHTSVVEAHNSAQASVVEAHNSVQASVVSNKDANQASMVDKNDPTQVSMATKDFAQTSVVTAQYQAQNQSQVLKIQSEKQIGLQDMNTKNSVFSDLSMRKSNLHLRKMGAPKIEGSGSVKKLKLKSRAGAQSKLKNLNMNKSSKFKSHDGAQSKLRSIAMSKNTKLKSRADAKLKLKSRANTASSLKNKKLKTHKSYT